MTKLDLRWPNSFLVRLAHQMRKKQVTVIKTHYRKEIAYSAGRKILFPYQDYLKVTEISNVLAMVYHYRVK